MVNQKALNYLKQYSDKYDIEQLKQKLISKGYSPQDVEEAASVVLGSNMSGRGNSQQALQSGQQQDNVQSNVPQGSQQDNVPQVQDNLNQNKVPVPDMSSRGDKNQDKNKTAGLKNKAQADLEGKSKKKSYKWIWILVVVMVLIIGGVFSYLYLL